MEVDKGHEQFLLRLLAGRTLNEQIEYIRKYGNHAVVPVIRDIVLNSAGITKPKETTENLIMFGCYLPFMFPLLLRDYLEILERLGLDYTYLEKEFCCGSPMIQATTGADNEKAREAGKKFVLMNRELARQKGATTISYWCVWCAHLAKRFFPGDTIRHLYYPDLILEKLENKTLRVAPTTVGYYEGCHRRNRILAPGVNLDWEKYRQLLDRIEGLEVVDLPNRICCEEDPECIVEAAEERNLGTILCSCVTCYRKVGTAAGGRIQMKYFPEILLQALEGE